MGEKLYQANRRTFLTAVGSGVGVTLAGCMGGGGSGGGGNGAGDFPSQSITHVNTYSEGGGTDTNLRQLQPYFDEELGVNTQIEYRAGAGTRIGTNYVANAPPDGYTIGATRSPAFEFTLLIDEEDTEYQQDDIYPIGSLMTEHAIIRARNDEDRFGTIEELVEYATANPGELTCGVSGPTNRNMLAMVLLMEETDAEFTMVPFDGGGATQTALLQGEIDIANRSVYNSADIADQTQALTIYAEENQWPDLTNDAPPLNEALGTDIPYGPTEGRQFDFAPAGLPDENPDRFEYIVDAYESAVSSDGYRSDLEELGEEDKISYMSPDETWNHIEQNLTDMEDYVDVMLQQVEE
ncbi:tripartite tricarboxylate transporter substrate binding protein [Halalkalicoccus sp. NIPERK01]|uniref:Bug family tripartite tricarboxylate transporter substrate binding protein n=1 Tax=Halalkalicoccus sp. NIPERK01 TaxID=3053469 RepID=UPI00256EFCB0|nr:tripartite tricarboxylate transporter substrate binding protein [Halalkalicoccus sp. NIPERK01]MDL5363463.1 tripartite tricarboxylate transporter substrate binding protein [Halalkalicoccus sp. NIPERK01]